MTQSENPLRIAAEPSTLPPGSAIIIDDTYQYEKDLKGPIELILPGQSGDPRFYVPTLPWHPIINLPPKDGWISPPRRAWDDVENIVQFTFEKEEVLNFLRFELLTVPQQWTVWYYDRSRGQMVQMTDKSGGFISGSTGEEFLNFRRYTDIDVARWTSYGYRLPLIKTNTVEFRIMRKIERQEEDTVPYVLGLRNVQFKFYFTEDMLDDEDDISTLTSLGIIERHKVYRHMPLRAIDGVETSYWQSSPQGAATSVVPFYLDTRDASGNSTTFDTMKLLPMWNGPSMSIYWSNDDTINTFNVSSNRVNVERFEDVTASGNASFLEDSGISVTGADVGWSISNDYIRNDLSASFWMGLQWIPTSCSADDRYLWTLRSVNATPSLQLKFDPTSFDSTTMTGEFKVVKDGTTNLFVSGSYTLTKDAVHSIVLGYNLSDESVDFTQGWYLSFAAADSVDFNSVTYEYSPMVEGKNIIPFIPSEMYLGTNRLKTLPCMGYIRSVCWKVESFTRNAVANYLANPWSYTKGSTDTSLRNTLLLAPLHKFLKARVGPGQGFWEGKVWNPIQIDYSLSTSLYKLPITSAKYLKLEFSNLVPHLYRSSTWKLPVYDFPRWVRDWYRTIQPNKSLPYRQPFRRNYFERSNITRAPGDPTIMPGLRSEIESGNDSQSLIFSKGNSTIDYVENSSVYDSVGAMKELAFATTPMKFIQSSVHEYEEKIVPVDQVAYFVGIKELELYRTDATLVMDNAEYYDGFDDDALISSNSGFVRDNGCFVAAAEGNQIISKTLPSISKFKTVQMAVLDSPWESMMTPGQIDIVTSDHLVDPTLTEFSSSTTTVMTDVTGQFLGARGGNVLKLSRKSGSTSPYGIRTDTGLFTGSPITGDNPRTSAVVRMQLPETQEGDYELRLYAKNSGTTYLRAVLPIKIPVKTWKELEVAYIAFTGDEDFQAAIVQTDRTVSEPFIVDMLGVFQNPIKWEVSNDGGSNYYPVLWGLNDPNGYVSFPTADTDLKVKITALRAGAIVSAWLIVPWYIESLVTIRAPIDFNLPWSISDSNDLRDVAHKPMFQIWNHFFPQVYSVNLLGYPVTRI